MKLHEERARMARMSVDVITTIAEGPDAMNRAGLRRRIRPRFDWQTRTRRLALGQRTLLMAIVNLTPDSFSSDGLFVGRGGVAGSGEGMLGRAMTAAAEKVAVAAAVAAVDDGADIVDLGAESTRPNAMPISADEEQARLLPVLEGLMYARPQAVVSVDTYHASTARIAARMGAEIINDVSGLTWDESMAAAVATTGCGLVLMHTRGRPEEWRTQTPLQGDEVVPLVFAGLCEQRSSAEAAGIRTERIVVDPGFGFGKQGAENFALLAGLPRLHELGRPLLVGLSRKRFLGDAVRSLQADGIPPAEARRTSTIAGHVAAVLAGAHLLRVHDLQAGREAAAVADAVLKSGE
jgi:dihydropteroate synthase